MKPSKYDQEFAEAMKVKLKLNRQKRLKAGEESALVNDSRVGKDTKQKPNPAPT